MSCHVMSCHAIWCLGPYPSLVNNTAGHKTLVVQAYAHTKVGNIDPMTASQAEAIHHHVVLSIWGG